MFTLQACENFKVLLWGVIGYEIKIEPQVEWIHSTFSPQLCFDFLNNQTRVTFLILQGGDLGLSISVFRNLANDFQKFDLESAYKFHQLKF